MALLVAFWVALALPNHAFVCTGTCQTCILRWIHAGPFVTTGAALARKMRIVLKQFKPSLFIFSVPADAPGLFMGMGGLVPANRFAVRPVCFASVLYAQARAKRVFYGGFMQVHLSRQAQHLREKCVSF